MKPARLLRCALLVAPLLVAASAAPAHEPADTAPPKDAAARDASSADHRAVLEVLHAFDAALRRGDLPAAEALLAPDLRVLEMGGMERSRDEYMQAHAPADAAFLATATIQSGSQEIHVSGDVAWTAVTTTMTVTRDGAPVTRKGTESMVLRRRAGGWRIVQIHWSSSR